MRRESPLAASKQHSGASGQDNKKDIVLPKIENT